MIDNDYLDSFSNAEITIDQTQLTLDGWSARTVIPEKPNPEIWETRTSITFNFRGDDAIKARAIIESLISGKR